jgi:hypothetical protein
MSAPHRATPEQRIEALISANEALRDRLSVLEEGYDELAARVEKVETGKGCFRIAALEAAANLQQQDEDAERAMEPAPSGGLVELVALSRVNPPLDEDDIKNAKAAILAVAKWLDTRGQHGCSLWLREHG